MAMDPKFRNAEENGLSIMKDVFGPILNGRNVEISIREMKDADAETAAELFEEQPVLVEAPLEGAVSETQYFIFGQKLAAGITDLMVMGDGSAPFDETEVLDGIAEAANQIVGAQATQWADELGQELRSGGAQGRLVDTGDLGIELGDMVMVVYDMEIEDWGSEPFVKIAPPNVFEMMASIAGDEGGGDDLDDFSAPAAGAGGIGSGGGGGQTQPSAPSSMKRAEFGEFESRPAARGGEDDPRNLDLLMDISLPVTIELGRTHMLIRDVLELGPGSVIELQKLSGEPVDLYINDKRFALGEVVVIDENFGIRITELISVEDRIKALK
jgi:flagellar motor switch protein FliN/FliY